MAASKTDVAPKVVGASGVAPAAAPSDDAQLDLELLRLSFDESEFGNMAGALRARPTVADVSDAGDDDDDAAKATSAPSRAATGSGGADDDEDDAEQDGTFNAHNFVAAKLEHVAAESLEKDLKTYERHLEAAVLKCVHDEVHEAFIHVSGELVSMEGTISKVQQPLADMEHKVGRMRTSIEAARGEAHAVLNEAARHEVARGFFAALLEASLVHNDTRRTIEAVKEGKRTALASSKKRATATTSQGNSPTAATPGPSPTAAEPMSPGASSVAGLAEYPSELAFLCASVVRLGQLCAIIQASAPDSGAGSSSGASSGAAVDEEDAKAAKELFALAESDAADVKDLVSTHFFESHRAYVSAPSSQAGSALGHATALFAQLGDDANFAHSYRERIVRPVVEDVITWRDASAAKSSAETTERVFTKLITELESSVFVAVPLVQRALGSAAPPLLASAVWPAIGDTIMKRLLHFFAPGLPNKFHKSFTIAARLVAALEAKCGSASELRALRSSPDMVLWRSKWNTDTYHEMRKHEMDARVKASGALQPPFKPVANSADAAAIQPFSIAQFHAVLQELSTILDPERVFLFALQHRFLKDACDLVLHLIDAAVAGCTGATPLEVIEVMRNCAAFAKAASITLSDRVTTALAGDATAAAGVIKLLRSIVESGVQRTRSALVSGLVAACMRNLELVSGVKRIFSSSNMPMPTQRSEYLKGALNDVSVFRDEAVRVGAMSKDECKDVVAEVIREATQGLKAAVRSVLANAKRQQESLDKLNRNKAKGPAAEKPREKIVMQLYLDIHEFGDMLRGFGVNKETDAGFKELIALVHDRAQWVLNECQGPEPADTH